MADLAERLLRLAAKRSTETQLGWAHPDCADLQEAARILRGDAPPKLDHGRAIGVLSGMTVAENPAANVAAAVAPNFVTMRIGGR